MAAERKAKADLKTFLAANEVNLAIKEAAKEQRRKARTFPDDAVAKKRALAFRPSLGMAAARLLVTEVAHFGGHAHHTSIAGSESWRRASAGCDRRPEARALDVHTVCEWLSRMNYGTSAVRKAFRLRWSTMLWTLIVNLAEARRAG